MEKLLVIEDAQGLRNKLRSGLSDEYDVVEGSHGAEGIALFKSHAPKVALLDLGLPDPEGDEARFRCLEAMIKARPEAKFIVLTRHQDRDTAYRAVAAGAYDFYQKPLELPELKIIIRRAFHLCRVEEQGRRLQEALDHSSAGIERIAGRCVAVQELLAPLQKAQRAPEPNVAEQRAAGQRRPELGADDYDASITSGHLTLREVRDRVEKSMIHAAVDNCGGNMAKASELLGVSRPALYDLMKKHGLFKPYARQ